MKPLLEKYIETLKENGFKVYANAEHPITYIFFEKDSQIGYCQEDPFYGLDFSTVHYPCSKYGTGFQTNYRIASPTIQHAEKTFILAPWFGIIENKGDISVIKKYSSFEEYRTKNKILKYIQL